MLARASGRMVGALVAFAVALAIAAPAALAKPNKPGKPPKPGSPAAQLDRYTIAGGCFGLHSEAVGAFVAKGGGTYAASAAGVSDAEPFRMQATTLGRYLFYGPSRDFLATQGDLTQAAAEPSDSSDWAVDESAGAFTITNGFEGRQLAVAGDGALVTVAAGTAGDAGRFAFREASGCATYPEVEVNATGGPSTGSPIYGEVSGLLEGHMHGMAFEFLGGRAHCGKPWHRFGAPYALVDCPDHEAGNGCGAVLENVLYGEPARCHDPVGWPTFRDWPHPKSLTHEQSYYKWIERAWRGGLRVYVNLLVENRVLCETYPLKQNNCDEMASVELQAQRLYELQDYIDAQSGGPGKGWFRIVTDPFEAREVVNDGKLAVVMGMEVSEPFGCRIQNEVPACDAQQIDAWLDRLHELGVRQLEIVNKFDNALTGVAGDNGTTGTVVNSGNFSSTGRFWDLETCHDPENHDHSPAGPTVHNDDLIIANGLDALLPGGLLPVYSQGPHCNTRGLSALGAHAVQGIIDRQMIFDPDHMSVYGRNQALELVESQGYSGIVSSHSWSTPNAFPRIFGLGGVITPYAGDSEGFVEKWQRLRQEFSGRQYFGVGYGADMNGFGAQGEPRGADVPNPVTYPFSSFDGQVILDRQRSGERVFDINTDGVAHYGLYPDWVEDLRMLAGDQIVSDLGRGAEAYLQMWERAEGIAPVSCEGWDLKRLGRRGLGARLRLGHSPRQVLESAGQPVKRKRAWRWCTSSGAGPGKEGGDRNDVVAVFTKRARVGLILSAIKRQRAGGIAVGTRVAKLERKAERLTGRLWVQDAGRKGRKFVYRVKGGRVRAVGIVSRKVGSKPKILRRHLKLARRG
jgi:microsomal dipeptidase-like Zn-dependent dipeptidase